MQVKPSPQPYMDFRNIAPPDQAHLPDGLLARNWLAGAAPAAVLPGLRAQPPNPLEQAKNLINQRRLEIIRSMLENGIHGMPTGWHLPQ